jgi:hypothetical protein
MDSIHGERQRQERKEENDTGFQIFGVDPWFR